MQSLVQFHLLYLCLSMFSAVWAAPVSGILNRNHHVARADQANNVTQTGDLRSLTGLTDTYNYDIPGTALTLQLKQGIEALNRESLYETLRGAQVFVSKQPESLKVPPDGFGWPPAGGSGVTFHIDPLSDSLTYGRLYDVLGGLTTLMYAEHRSRIASYSVVLKRTEGNIQIAHGFVRSITQRPITLAEGPNASSTS